MTKYKTKDGNDVMIPGVGVTVDGTIETEQKLESPILEEVSQSVSAEPASQPPVAVTPTVITTSTEIKEQI